MTTFYQHPHYQTMRADWTKYRDLYEGKHATMVGPGYLWLHAQEKNQADPVAQFKRSSRQERTQFISHEEIVISIWQSLLFRNPYSLDEEMAALMEQTNGEKDIDGNGMSLMTFIKDRFFQDFLLYGKAIARANAPQANISSLAEQIEQGIRPYLELIAPLDAPDWEVRKIAGKNYNKLWKFRYNYDLVADRETLEQEPAINRYTEVISLRDGQAYAQKYFTRLQAQAGGWTEIKQHDRTVAYVKDGEEIALGLDHLPVVVLEDESWVKHVASESLRYHNIRSNKDNIQYNQAYQKCYASGVNVNMTSGETRQMSESTIAIIPGENVSFHTIDPVNLDSYDKTLSESTNNIFKIGLNMLRQLPADSAGIEGADTIQSQKDEIHALAKSTIEKIENSMNIILKDFATLAGNDSFDGKLTLSKDITKEDYERFTRTVLAHRDTIGRYPKLKQAVDRKTVQALGLPNEEELLEEVDTVKPVVQVAAIRQDDPLAGALNG